MINPSALQDILARFDEVNAALSAPDIASDQKRMADLGREHSSLEDVVRHIRAFQAKQSEQADLEELLQTETDPEITAMASDELRGLKDVLVTMEEELEVMLIPKDPDDGKNAIVEIRAGTGGDEASLFAGDLFRLYSRYAERRGWKVDVMDTSHGTKGGYKEITFGIAGADVFGVIKYESGVHRVQRVPETESSGRVHTSAATVAVLSEADEIDVEIRNEDLEIDVYRSSGPGGQSVNTTDSAVRITHKPTGLVVTCQDEKSQHKNKDKAMRVLRARLFEVEKEKQDSERSEARRGMVGSGDRSAKIRTYNWPQGRVTDHRLEGQEKNHALQDVVDGKLERITQALIVADNAKKLAGNE